MARARSRLGTLALVGVALATPLQGCDPGVGGGSEYVALTGRLIDGTGALPVEEGVVVVRGDRIHCAGSRDECPIPRGARRIDAQGGTILPGLIDLHVHARPHYVSWFPRAGVTTIRDAGNAVGVAGDLERGNGLRPRIVWTGPMIAGPESVVAGLPSARNPHDEDLLWANPLLVSTPMEAATTLGSLAVHRVGALKLYEHLEPDVFHALVEGARTLGIPTMADLGMQLTRGLDGTRVDALEAIRAGVGSLEHMSGFALAYQRAGGDPGAEELDEALIEALVSAALEGGTFFVPTFVSTANFADPEPSVRGLVNEDLLHDGFLEEWAQRHPLPPSHRGRAEADLRLARALVRGIVEEGGADRIGAGTDAPNPWVVPGGSLHRELALLVEAGLTPLEAIRAATGTAARILGRDDVGVLAAGRFADVVVVDGNPAEEIGATARIRLVLLGGKPVDRDGRASRRSAEPRGATPARAATDPDPTGTPPPAIDTALARAYFEEARALADADGGALWGIPLHGPMLFVHPPTRTVVASEPDEEGVLEAAGGVWVGTLPSGVLVANTVSRWGGKEWAMYMWPVPTDPGDRALLLMHELWHRIQPDLGLSLPDAANEHLETAEGRAWMRLEWKALAEALRTTGPSRDRAVRDALLFRTHRRALFPGAGREEGRTEVTEGMAEYTAFRLSGLSHAEQRSRMARRLEQAQGWTQSIARPSGYLTGTALGLLLDDAGVEWVSLVGGDFDLAAALGRAMGVELSGDVEPAALARTGAYEGRAVFAAEEERSRLREEVERAYRARLVEGPVLVLPFEGGRRWSGDFGATTLLEGHGRVWAWIEIQSGWGAMTATEPVLVTDHAVIVPAPDDPQAWPPRGAGWSLEPSGPEWRLEPGARPGDYRLTRNED